MKKTDLHKCQHVKLYGTTTVGTKGQIVIPAGVRKELDINPGDQMLVMVKLGKAIGLVKANQLEELHEAIEKEMLEIKDSNDLSQVIKKEMQAIKDSNN